MQEPKKALLIVNPISGTRSKKGIEEMTSNCLAHHGISLETAYTEGPRHASELAARAVENGVGIVIAAGGDGTVNETASSLAHTDTVLGIIPLGSGNGLARTIGIPQNTEAALNIISSGHFARCDRGLVNGLPFYCTFGIGFDAAVSEKFALEKRRGRITYVRNVIREFLSYRSQNYAIAVDGQVIVEKAFLIAVCNASQYGNNAFIAPHAKLSDGMLDLIVVHQKSPLSTVKVGIDLMTGFLDKNTQIDSFKIKSATISRMNDGPVHIDGEPLKLGKAMKIKCDPGALSVFCPENDMPFRPIISPLRAMLADFRYDIIARMGN